MTKASLAYFSPVDEITVLELCRGRSIGLVYAEKAMSLHFFLVRLGRENRFRVLI